MGETTITQRNINIKVVHNSDGTYTASWGSSTGQTAFSAATALRMLADEFDALGTHGSNEEHLRHYRVMPDTRCKYCKAPIFFAVVPSGKWLAFDPDPVEGKLESTERVASFPRHIQTSRGLAPSVKWHFGNSAKIPTFVPHPQTCGDNVTAPASEPLRVRWEKNRTVTQARVDRAIAGLRSIRAEIGQGVLDDPFEHEPDRSGPGNNRA